MKFVSKIDFKKFTPLSLAVLGLFCFFTRNINELYVVLGVYITTLLNLVMLVEAIMELTQVEKPGNTKAKPNKEKIIYLFIGKILVLLLGLTWGVQIIGNRIIIAVINYIIQIFVLVLCLKKANKIA